MKLIQRVGYYLGGFSIGLVLLAFFLNGKKVSCDYGPEARVLKNINTKKIIYSSEFNQAIEKRKLDSNSINSVLKYGNIDFSQSDTRIEPCGLYFIEGELEATKMALIVENCDSIATIKTLKWNID